jgi:hypothetical protein
MAEERKKKTEEKGKEKEEKTPVRHAPATLH